VVADFFCGGGTTPAVAQRLGRQWIACDQSRVAVAVTADRLIRGAQQLQMDLAIPDFTVEYWGRVRGAATNADARGRVPPVYSALFGATPNTDPNEPHIHGYKGSVPVWVCPARRALRGEPHGCGRLRERRPLLDPLPAVRLARWR
jgi:adenine-specific DNA-methyltransferase